MLVKSGSFIITKKNLSSRTFAFILEARHLDVVRPLEDVLQVGAQLQQGHLGRRRGVVPGQLVNVVDVVLQGKGLAEGKRKQGKG